MSGLDATTLRRYILVIAAGNLAWEILQLPLYHIWYHAHAARLAIIIVDGTGGDVMIAIVSLVGAFCLFGRSHAAPALSPRVTWGTIAFGLAYTIASEAVHLKLGTWHYAPLMPRLPILGVGVAPTLQWIVIPPLALRAAGGCFRSPPTRPEGVTPLRSDHTPTRTNAAD
jgi:hypothetical protein